MSGGGGFAGKKIEISGIRQSKNSRILPQLNGEVLILSGGPGFSGNFKVDTRSTKKIIGICLGMALLADRQGVRSAKALGEFGKNRIRVLGAGKKDPILKNIPPYFNVWMSHSEAIKAKPRGFKVLAVTERGYPAILRKNTQILYQFHPEVSHTEYGLQLLANTMDFLGQKKGRLKSLFSF